MINKTLSMKKKRQAFDVIARFCQVNVDDWKCLRVGMLNRDRVFQPCTETICHVTLATQSHETNRFT